MAVLWMVCNLRLELERCMICCCIIIIIGWQLLSKTCGILAFVCFDVNATNGTMLIGGQPLINTVHMKQMHAWKTTVWENVIINKINSKTIYVSVPVVSYRTSFSISNSDKQIVHFSPPSSSSSSLQRRIRLYLCGNVLLSITSWLAPRNDRPNRDSSMTRTNWCSRERRDIKCGGCDQSRRLLSWVGGRNCTKWLFN